MSPDWIAAPHGGSILIPMRTQSLNVREHPMRRAHRLKGERTTVGWHMASTFGRPHAFVRARITLTRMGPRRMDDDNVVGALKATRDAVADWLGVDDGSERLEWRYAQQIGPYAVRVEFEYVQNSANSRATAAKAPVSRRNRSKALAATTPQ